MEVSRYIFEPLRRDDDFILYRSHSRLEEQTSLLLLASIVTRPPIDTIRKIENEYSLRGERGDSWAVKPLTLSKYNGPTALVLEDPSGEPLNRLMHGPMELKRFLQLAVGLAAVLDQAKYIAKNGHANKRYRRSTNRESCAMRWCRDHSEIGSAPPAERRRSC